MRIQPKLLDHPFYQAWMKGDVPIETLAAYHRSYRDFTRRIPGYWQRVVEAFAPDIPAGRTVIQDELDHIVLWDSWGRSLPAPRDFPRLDALTTSLDEMTPSALLGALQAFEIQQPEVARTKKEGLVRHYGARPEDLAYFDAHQHEEGHIAFGRTLARRIADRREFNEGFSRGAELVYSSLDGFLPRN